MVGREGCWGRILCWGWDVLIVARMEGCGATLVPAGGWNALPVVAPFSRLSSGFCWTNQGEKRRISGGASHVGFLK